MGARLVLDLNQSGSSSPQSMISIDGMLYFTADLGGSGEEQSIPEVVVATDRVYDPWQKVFLCSIDWRKNP